MAVPGLAFMRPQRAASALVAVLAAAGCGGGNGGESSSTPTSATSATGAAPSAGGGTTLSLSADPSKLRFDKSSLSAKAGTVTLKMTNPSAILHNIGITGKDLPDQIGETVGKGGTSTVTVKVTPGTYDFYCAVDGHRGAGMSGELTVR
jgi:plastocyanin